MNFHLDAFFLYSADVFCATATNCFWKLYQGRLILYSRILYYRKLKSLFKNGIN